MITIIIIIWSLIISIKPLITSIKPQLFIIRHLFDPLPLSLDLPLQAVEAFVSLLVARESSAGASRVKAGAQQGRL